MGELSRPKPLLFAGPTLARAVRLRPELRARLGRYELRPPIERGAVQELVETGPPRTLVIVDGFFQQRLAVSHRELRAALAAGWVVWGLGSLGAIRAREMSHLGMRGFGRVYARYCEPGDVRDDEVMLLHGDGPEYRELSEPLVHLRLGLEGFAAANPAAAAQVTEVTAWLEEQWFGERTVAGTAGALRARLPAAHEAVAAWQADFDRYRVKALDLIAFVERDG